MTTPSAARDSGFTLVEALVALMIVGLALLLEVGAQWQSRAALDGLAVESALLKSAEATVESVRAGALPLTSGPVDAMLALPRGSFEAGQELSLAVGTSGVAGLCRLSVRGRARDRRGRLHSIELQTQVWRPGASCR
jgi:prepilin-type N-terminal cleavage/methylation domain-containing protein